MALIVIERRTGLTAQESWRRVTRWERHADRVPLTRIRVTHRPPGTAAVGLRFTARTGVGRAGFDDPMEIVGWQPPDGDRPGVCRIEKRGRLVTGWAEIEVRARPDGSEVRWREELRVAGLPRWCDGLTALSGRVVFGRAIGGLLAAG